MGIELPISHEILGLADERADRVGALAWQADADLSI